MALWKTKDYTTTGTALSSSGWVTSTTPSIDEWATSSTSTTSTYTYPPTSGWISGNGTYLPSVASYATSSMKVTIPDLEKAKEQIEDLTQKLEKIEHKLDSLDNLYGRLNQLIKDLDAKIELVDIERTADTASVKADAATKAEFRTSESLIKDELKEVQSIAYDCDYHLKTVDGQVKDLYDIISHVEDAIYKGV